jgi:5-methyltetrahydrofolate--homocysteine methyltransferase
MGTAIQDAELSAEDYGGAVYEGCPEILVDTRPDLILEIHRGYLRAGADIIETDTFGGTPLVLAEYGLAERCRELNRKAAQLARQACEEFGSTRQRFVAGSMGPTTKAISVTGGVTFVELLDHFFEQARGLIEGGADLLLVETQQDSRNAKAAVLGCQRAFSESGTELPIILSGTIEASGTMLAGQSAEAFVASMAHFDLLAIGLNCATGPAFMADSLRSMSEIARTRVSVHPNAGLPDTDGNYPETPSQMAKELERFVDEGWVNLVGGCCGTTPEHIAAIAKMVSGKSPREIPDHSRALYSGIELVESTPDNRPLLVGERTNVIGSRRFKRLIAEGKFEEASEIARAQARAGAQILDVCLADPDADERHNMSAFLEEVIKKVKLPLMIDTTDREVFEIALPYCQGKSILNSINLEDGESRFEQVLPLARRFGAAVVVGCIDEDPQQGMAVTRQRKLEIARRSHRLLTEKYGLRDEDIIFDPLTFPCGTGDAAYVGSARETIEGLRLIKEEFPDCRTILGVSNVSFGLPTAGREVLNAVFLYHCTKAGLDLAIVNSQRLERYASIPKEELELSEDLLFDRSQDPVAAFAAHFRGAKKKSHTPSAKLPLDERLQHYIIDGSKEGLIDDLELKRKESEPLDIINGPLMDGMAEVGRLFNDNQLIVAEVLQSAEAMKAAVTHLEKFMEKSSSSSRGKVILATVKGDVHDIGKNLVDIILSNNGFEVVNLGIKVAPETLVKAVKEEQPAAIGLSGLLVKSAQQMVVTAQDLKAANVSLPLFVGGAALSARFTHERIAPAYAGPTLYAKDAMGGLDLFQRALGKEGPRPIVAEQEERTKRSLAARQASGKSPTAVQGAKSTPARKQDFSLDSIPEPPDSERHLETVEDLDEIWTYLNPQMLYGKHLGFKGNFARKLAANDSKAQKLREVVEEVKGECRQGSMRVRAVWQFFAAQSRGNEIHLFASDATQDEETLASWEFPRQNAKEGLCLADYVLAPKAGRRDHLALFVVTAGGGILERSAVLKDEGEYLRSHVLAALALETAEAAAEWLHQRLRAAWGFPDPKQLNMTQRLQAKYRGKRYSFGYPACPDLEGQRELFRLLRPEEIGVELSEGCMMSPEASVSALVFHHPAARYFNA